MTKRNLRNAFSWLLALFGVVVIASLLVATFVWAALDYPGLGRQK